MIGGVFRVFCSLSRKIFVQYLRTNQYVFLSHRLIYQPKTSIRDVIVKLSNNTVHPG